MTLPVPPRRCSWLTWDMKFLGCAALAILFGFLIGHGASWWEWYGQNRDKVIPFFVPLANIFGALATLAVGIFIARAALAQADTARLRHEEQTKADLQRRITESYLKAVEQLGSDKIAVRLGGIYTLERISRESPGDYWTVMETLCAFVREQARWKESSADSLGTLARFYETDTSKNSDRPPTDIATVLAVIVRRDEKSRQREHENDWRLDFAAADLRGAFLVKAHLEKANLREAHLEKANLREAHLEKADLRDAHLEEAELIGAHLEGACLYRAHLEEARLQRARLQEADLVKAHLESSSLQGAHLEGASLDGAYLNRLRKNPFSEPPAIGFPASNSQNGMRTHLGGAHLQGADLSNAHLEDAILAAVHFNERTCLTGTHIEGAYLGDASGLSENQLSQALGDAATYIPAGMTRPAHWSPEEPKAEEKPGS